MRSQGQAQHEAEHTIDVGAPADEVYRLLADVQNWPRVFPPTIHVDRIEQSDRQERIRIWATANGSIKNWTSRRTLNPQERRIEFRQEVSAPPVAAMGGTWVVEPISGTSSRVRLAHDFRAIGDDPDSVAWIEQAVDRNSRAELAALRVNAEADAGTGDELMSSFSDTVTVNGDAKYVYDFINEAGHWRERLPHVRRVELTEDSPGLQTLEMDTVAKDGSTHTTKSIRVCFPHNKIVYKQITLPALLAVHTGQWLLTEDDAGVSVTSQHTIVINPANVTKVLGPDASVAAARRFVCEALSANSLVTLGHAKKYAESHS